MGLPLLSHIAFLALFYLFLLRSAFFAFVRLELLSRVRGIINKKQIEIEQHFLEEGQLGKVEHFQKEFYDGGDRPTLTPKLLGTRYFSEAFQIEPSSGVLRFLCLYLLH